MLCLKVNIYTTRTLLGTLTTASSPTERRIPKKE